jgi:hypothetical protein
MFTGWFTTKQKPWTQGEPIIEQIRRWDGKRALRLYEQPPDSDPKKAPSESDSATGERWDEARLVTEFLELMRLLMMRGNEQARGALYAASVKHPITSLIDIILHELHRQSWWQAGKVRPHARWFIEQSRHCEPLRFGIALLGLSGTKQDLSLLKDVARHDEFTIAAANAVSSITDDPVEQWWQMAKQVQGWSKVHLVKRLARRRLENAEVQDWLLRQGWRDCPSTEYLAYACASAGRLDQALARPNVDDELLESTGRLIGAMLVAGPAEHLEDYEGGVAAISKWLPYLENRRVEGKTLEAVKRLLDWVEQDNQPQVWERRAEQLGWTEEVRAEIAARCRAIIARAR